MMNANYVKYLNANKKSPKTINSYTAHVNQMLEYIGKADAEITYADLIDWQESISNLSSATVALKVAAIKNYFEYLVKAGEIDSNPALNLEKPSVHNKPKHYMSATMIREMVNHARTYRDRATIMLFASTGLRFEEMANITLADYDQMKHDENHALKIMGKGAKERFIYFNEETIRMTDKYLANCDVRNCDRLFVSFQGNPMQSNNYGLTLKAIAKNAGISFWKEISPHCLRAACATMLNEHNVDTGTIRDVLGHASIATTQRYIKTSEEMKHKAMANSLF